MSNNNKNNVNNSKQVVNVIIDHYRRRRKPKKKVKEQQQMLYQPMRSNVMPMTINNMTPGMPPSFNDLHKYHTSQGNANILQQINETLEEIREIKNHFQAAGDLATVQSIAETENHYQAMANQVEQEMMMNPPDLPQDQDDLGFPQGSSRAPSVAPSVAQSSDIYFNNMEGVIDEYRTPPQQQQQQQDEGLQPYTTTSNNPTFEDIDSVFDEMEQEGNISIASVKKMFPNASEEQQQEIQRYINEGDVESVQQVAQRLSALKSPRQTPTQTEAGPSNISPIQQPNFETPAAVPSKRPDNEDDEPFDVNTPDIKALTNTLLSTVQKDQLKVQYVLEAKDMFKKDFTMDNYRRLSNDDKQRFKTTLLEFAEQYYKKIAADKNRKSVNEANITTIRNAFGPNKRIDNQLKLVESMLEVDSQLKEE